MLKIGILQTDSVLEQFQPRFGDYPEMFTNLLRRAAAAHVPPLELDIRTIDVRGGVLPEPTSCDAYLITGSRHSVYDDLPWIPPLVEFLRRAIAAGRKVVGICFGHQLLAHYFGGETRPAAGGWAVGVHETRLVGAEDWMEPAQSEVALVSSHKDQVARLPEGARLIASTPFCPIAGFVLGRNVMTLQGHPEFEKGYSASLMDMRREILGEDVYAKGMASLEIDTDEAVVGGWILNFIAGAEAGR